MRKLIPAAAGVLLAANFALAQTPAAGDKKAPSEKQLQQQGRMKACNKEAGDKKLKSDARKQFMSECLKGDKPAAPANAAKPTAPATPAQPAKKQ